MGFFWTIVTLVGRARARVALPRLVHGGGLRRPRALARLGRAADLPRCSARARSRSRPGSATPARSIIFSAVSMGVTYLILRIQGSLPLNPQHLGAVPPALSFNTAASFVTNTNWQNYGGEETMSYFSQIGALTFQQFVSPAVGIVAAIAHGARLLPAQLGDDRQLLGRHDPCDPLHPAADRLRRRAHLRRPRCGRDPRRDGQHPRRA